MPEGSGFSACSQLKSRLTSLIASRYFRNFPTTCSSSDVKLCPTKAWIFFISNLTPHPHFEYPQFNQVAHPSMITTHLVLHLWHMLADGGKGAPSPVTAMSSAGSSMLASESIGSGFSAW